VVAGSVPVVAVAALIVLSGVVAATPASPPDRPPKSVGGSAIGFTIDGSDGRATLPSGGSADTTGKSANVTGGNRIDPPERAATAADASAGVDVVVGSATGRSGTTGHVSVTIENGNIAGYRMTMTFDPDVIHVRSATGVEFADPIVNINNSAGTVVLTASQATAETDPVLADLEVEFVGTAGETAPIDLVPKETSVNDEVTNLDVAVRNGSATVEAPVGTGPEADAGKDRTVTANSTVELGGTSSSDPSGGTLAYSWTQTAGPTVALSDVNTSTPEFRAPTVTAPRTLTFALVVTDRNGTSARDAVNVTVEPHKNDREEGVLRVGNVTGAPNTTATVPLSVRGDADVAGYRTTLWFDPAVVRIRSVDGIDLNDPIVNIDNTAGKAVIAQSEATERTDPTLATLTLAFVGTVGQSSRLSLDPSETSLNDATSSLDVTTNNGTARTVQGDRPVGQPIADAGDDIAVGSGETVELNGTASTDPDDDEIMYTWKQDSGPPVIVEDRNSATPSVTTPVVGKTIALSFQVVVRDSDGNRDSDTVVVEVAELPPGPPISDTASSPTDLDEDGRYEDVNGNGEREYDDVVVLFEGFESQSVRSSVGRFDFNANDRLDFADIVHLFEAV
jgi:hypothetical protein